MFTFNHKYFLLALFLFVVEVLIALYVKDSFVRPYVGDYLVVMLIYCSIRAIIRSSPLKVAVGTLLFAYLVELLQYLNLIVLLDLKNSTVANVILGNRFEWIDMLAYTLGVLTILGLERASVLYPGKGYF